MHLLAFALKWEPELHGLVVLVLAVVLLPGSVYLLLATNLGARVGFLIAAAGLFGWMAVMGLVWTVYGIGLKGNAPSWKVQETITGNVAASPSKTLDAFPKGWHKLATDSPQAAEAVAAADPTLAPPAGSGKSGPYTSSSDYFTVGAFDAGGAHYFPGWNGAPDFIAFKHKPHFFVLQVEKALKQQTVPGQPPPKAAPDPSAPVTSVLMVRDLGTLRVPAAEVMVFSLMLFAACTYTLHYRDKQAWAARGSQLEPAGRGR
jgi:hypothetical protein